MGKPINNKNDKYGKWTLLNPTEDRRKWAAVCDCGNICTIWINNLRTGKSKQCVKCQSKLLSKKTHLKTHGLSKKNKNLYAVWNGIKRRCYNKNQKSYIHYGAKGVVMCEEWRSSFVNFFNWAMANGYKKGLEITRNKDIGNYSPDNCSIKTKLENMQERKYKATLDTLNKCCKVNCGLTDKDLKEIIKLGTSGLFKNKYIAEMFNIERHTVTKIIKRNGFEPKYITRN